MAILKKRTSSKTLPEAKGVNRAPLDSVIRGVGSTPSISGGSRPSITSAGGSGAASTPKTSLTTSTSTAPKTTLTSTTAPKTTTSPTITNKTSTTPTTKTTSPTSVVKPTVKPATTKPNSTANTVVNALTGAALGAGTKLLIDKFTGKPATSTSKPNVATGSGAPANSTAAKTAAAAATAKKVAEAKNAEAKKAAGSTTSVVKPPVEDEFVTDEKGNTYKVMPDGTEVLYRAADVPEDEYMTDSLGNVYKTMPDGTYQLYRSAEVAEDTSVYPPNTVPAENTLSEGEEIVSKDGSSPTRGLGSQTSDASIGSDVEDASNTVVADNTDVEYFQDDYGNVYTMNADGSYELYSDAGGSTGDGVDYADNTLTSEEDPLFADNTFFDEDTGATWTMADNGEWSTDFNWDDYFANDYTLSDNSEYTDYNDYTDYTDYSDYEYAKRGGLITMMKDGGVAKFDSGGYVDNGDGTYTIGNFTYDMMTDEYLYSTDPDTGNISNVSSDAVYSTDPANDYYDSDSLGNIFKNGELYLNAADVPSAISSSGGGDRPWYENLGSTLSKGVDIFKGVAGGGYDALTGALGTTAGAAGAGALVATLLGQDFSGGTGEQNEGLDMSKVGVINPRTTDFGIGPTRYVGYEDYGTTGGEYTPNEELLRNLNAPGYNPVNEGDYGYEEVPAEETAEEPKMASGGLSSMATPVASYYTFGQPADILANLGMRQQPPMNPPEMMPQIGQQQSPQQTQQQGLPQQAPPQMAQQTPQGMPQQGIMPQQQGMAPPMRKGGLPHVSNVPLVQGRMDFRKGSAVHGAGDGQSDDIPAMLADGEYVIDAETVAQIGNGSTKAGAQALDKFRESIRSHKRSAPINKIPPKTKALTSYLKG